MKCHYTIDPKSLKKVFIPMCWQTIYTLSKEGCCCSDPLTTKHFEKESFNKILLDKNQTIEALQAEIKHLNKIILPLLAKWSQTQNKL